MSVAEGDGGLYLKTIDNARIYLSCDARNYYSLLNIEQVSLQDIENFHTVANLL